MSNFAEIVGFSADAPETIRRIPLIVETNFLHTALSDDEVLEMVDWGECEKPTDFVIRYVEVRGRDGRFRHELAARRWTVSRA